MRRYAPRSVLTFGRAVSVFDYEAIAAQAPGVTRARAVWGWNDARQRTMVTVYVGDDAAAAASAKSRAGGGGRPEPAGAGGAGHADCRGAGADAGGDAGDGHRPDQGRRGHRAERPRNGPVRRLELPIGQPVFDSQIEAAVLAVPGVVALIAATFYADGAVDPSPLHNPGEGNTYVLDPADINPVTEPDANGG